jgi:homospermidine synthase
MMGYGAIGKCFAEILLSNFPNINLIIIDKLPPPEPDPRFKYVQLTVQKDNYQKILTYAKKGDILVDLSTNIDVICIWELCMKNGIMYMNTSMESWEDAEEVNSLPKSLKEMLLGFKHEQMFKNK